MMMCMWSFDALLDSSIKWKLRKVHSAGHPRLWLRGGMQVDCGLLPSDDLAMNDVFSLLFLRVLAYTGI